MMFYPIETIYGTDGVHSTPYLTRVKLTPMTPWGQMYLHIFHRGDADRDPHDHPFSFHTFPLTSYVEEVMNFNDGSVRNHIVRRLRWHYRSAEYAHRVAHSYLMDGPGGRSVVYLSYNERARARYSRRVWTLIWRSPNVRKWGFWVENSDSVRLAFSGADWDVPRVGNRIWIPWKNYVYGAKAAERAGEVSSRQD